jgi:hypothetical protein
VRENLSIDIRLVDDKEAKGPVLEEFSAKVKGSRIAGSI